MNFPLTFCDTSVTLFRDIAGIQIKQINVMKNLKILSFALAMSLVIASCQEADVPSPVTPDIDNALSKSDNARPKTMVWADGELFESVVTPAVFDGEKGNYDILYAGGFYDGVQLISESKPGDQDYNGGRWAMYVLKDGVTTDYSMATSDHDLDPDDFESNGNYFECPLLPRRGRK